MANDKPSIKRVRKLPVPTVVAHIVQPERVGPAKAARTTVPEGLDRPSPAPPPDELAGGIARLLDRARFDLRDVDVHVRLTPSHLGVSGRGNLSLLQGWSVHPVVDRADWPSWNDGSHTGGSIFWWLADLEPGRQYVFELTLGAWPHANTVPRVEVTVDEEQILYSLAGAEDAADPKTLLGVYPATSEGGLIRIEPVDIDLFMFHSAVLRRV